MRRLWLAIVMLVLSSVALAQDEPLQVVATTSIIADVARAVGGELVEVSALLPPEADPHAYQPTPQDLIALETADVVLVNGFGLEAFLNDLPQGIATVEPVSVSEGITPLPVGGLDDDDAACIMDDEHTDEHADDHGNEHTDEHADDHAHDHAHDDGTCDPHVWLSVQNVMVWVDNIAEVFSAADPDNAEAYAANAAAYREALVALDEEIQTLVERIPQEKRVLVVNHNFLTYFAEAYGFDVVGVVIEGASTLAEPSPRALADLLAVIEAYDAPAIFVEIGVNTRLAETLAQEAGIDVVALYSGALSDEDGPASTYVDYMRYNAQTIVNALAGTSDE